MLSVWSYKCQKSFDQLKNMLTEALADTSLNGLGCVLMHAGKVVAYASRQLNEKCHVFTDHKSLKYLMTQKELNLRQRRWLKLLKDYDLIIDYHPRNVVADALSRKSSLFALRALNAYLTLNEDGSLLEELRTKPLFLQRIQELQNEDSSTEYNVDDNGTLRYRDRICVLNHLELKHDILSKAHSSTYSIHLGSTKIYCDLKQMYCWSVGNRASGIAGFTKLLPVTPRKKESIWVIVDRLTKSTHIISVKTDFSLG
ncbi:DNA/RNA polymerases superfamily protein [Gossypium australe]|uniref:DNA/RNA polymerases superfamily protein n=1 Tax=Gossypium australe TaxID=47621 RepID=A0A5B6VP45_9ROSI|nr:DNA/RNA polymerases superfamily protein [Gossypium australe]